MGKFSGRQARPLGSKGFTIIELMIAISVLSMILLLVTIGIVQLSKTYYKGVIQANAQQTAREITDTVSQVIQYGSFSSTVQPGSTMIGGLEANVICVGTQQFSFILKAQKLEGTAISSANNTSPHALWQDRADGACAAAPLGSGTPSADGRELLGDKMRLTAFSVDSADSSGTGTLFRVSVTVMYGDSDLIDMSSGDSSEWTCKSTQSMFSSAFCGKSELTTVVGKRL